MEENGTVLAGMLLKKGNKGFKKLWKKRWVVVKKNSNFIEYFSSSTETERILGKIDIQNITSVGTSKKKFSIRIHTTSRTFSFRAKNEQEVEYWLAGISLVLLSFNFFSIFNVI